MQRNLLPAPSDDLFIVGWDTESTKRNGRNWVVSYQIALLWQGQSWHWLDISNGRKLTMAQMLSLALEQAKRDSVFQEYPKQIFLAAHWTLADLLMLADFPKLKKQFDSIRRTYVTVCKGLKLTLTDSNRHQRQIEVILRDTMLLTPQGKSLKHLGDLHGLPKIELPEGAIERMDLYQAEHPEEFKAYALRDAEIAAQHCQHMAELNRQWTGRHEVPVTLGSLAARYAQSVWENAGVDWRRVFGRTMVKTEEHTNRGCRTRIVEKELVGYALHAGLAEKCYMGGRNETLIFGATEMGSFRDYDLAGAYTTVQSILREPQWDQYKPTTHLEDYGLDTFGFAHVKFKFPLGTRLPTLAVSTPFGLVFPMQGQTFATAPEIFAARQIGAEIKILHGVVIPTGDFRPFAQVIAALAKERSNYPPGTLGNALRKDLGNSLYGKTAQGTRKKNVFDARTGRSKPMPKSQLTNPYFAAWVTGYIRALLGEILNALPEGRTVVSVTTDGFICDASEGEMVAAVGGPLAAHFVAARRSIAGESRILEVKHTARQVLAWRTRGQATLVLTDGQKPILAKAGLKAPGRMGQIEENDWVIHEFGTRDSDSRYEVEFFRSLREIWHEGGDLEKEKLNRRLGMDYDFKRQPASATLRSINGQGHLAFTTIPWQTVEHFLRCRENWESFQRQTGRCLRTLEDLQAFLEYLAASGAPSQGVSRSLQGGPLKLATRQFLRALRRGEWGLPKGGWEQKEIAEWMTAGGYPTSLDDVKYAGRKGVKLAAGVVPPTDEVVRFVAFVNTRFPGFEATQMLTREPAGVSNPPAKNGPVSQLGENQ